MKRVIARFRSFIRFLRGAAGVPLTIGAALPAQSVSPARREGRRGGSLVGSQPPRLPVVPAVPDLLRGNVVHLNARRARARYTEPDELGGDAA